MSFEEFVKEYECTDVDSRIERLIERQQKSNIALQRLMTFVDTIVDQTYSPRRRKKPQQRNNAYSPGNNFLHAFGSLPSTPSSSASTVAPSLTSTTTLSAMRQNQVFSTQFKIPLSPCQSSQQVPPTEQYPLQVGDMVILGPNGTRVHVKLYNSIIWSSSASATRQLLEFVFTSDTLATHTLTGKPSPAFYGRERPAKMQLDPLKARDVIHCVRAKLNCSEREIRAAITTKCSDTSKKYKRRSRKQMEED